MKRMLPFFVFYVMSQIVAAQDIPGIEGAWKLQPEKSEQVVYYRSIRLDIHPEKSHIRIVQRWEERFPKVDSLDVSVDGAVNLVPVSNRVWPAEVFMGVSMVPGDKE